MDIQSSQMFNGVTIFTVLTIMCWDFSSPLPKSSIVDMQRPKVFATAMCTDTYDTTTYTKRMDVKTACTQSVENCVEQSEKSCPAGLVPLTVWLTDG